LIIKILPKPNPKPIKIFVNLVRKKSKAQMQICMFSYIKKSDEKINKKVKF